MTLTRWSPVSGLATLEVDRLNRMFDAVFGQASDVASGWAPAVDIYENADRSVVLSLELPAVKRDDIKVTIDNHVLTVHGERKIERPAGEAAGRYHRQERATGTFHRSFTLPPSLDGSKVEAAYQDGVLTLTLPERPEAKPRSVAIG